MDPRMAARRRVVQETHARRSLHRLVRVLVLLAVVAAVVWAFRSPLLSVQQIVVSGADQVDVVSSARSAGLRTGIPMMDVDVDATREALLGDPWVLEASVTRQWPQSVAIEITERVPVAWVGVEDGWAEVSVDGVALNMAAAPAAGAPVLMLPTSTSGEVPDQRGAVGIIEFLAALPPELQNGASVQSRPDGFEGLVGGYQIRIGSGDAGREKALALAALLENPPEEGSIVTVIAPGQPAVLPPGAVPEAPDEVPDEVPDDLTGG